MALTANEIRIGNNKKAKCYNCKFASKQFKVSGKTHVHCLNEELYPPADFESGKLSAWDTLIEWWSTCKKHELIFKP
jgi:hypothetical protein